MKIFLYFTLLIASIFCKAQIVDTLKVGDRFKRFDQLVMGEFQELSYLEIDGKTVIGSLTTKRVEQVQKNGLEYLAFTHQWTSGKKDAIPEYFYFLCKPETLKPVLLIRKTEKEGKEAFRFDENQIVALDTVTDNTLQNFILRLNTPTFNWQIDIETYSLLPMKKDYHVVMNFYHPGGSKPDYYHLKVIGEERISLPNGKSMDCWILFTDYHGKQPSKFWYTKEGQNFVKMQGSYGKMVIHKVRLY